MPQIGDTIILAAVVEQGADLGGERNLCLRPQSPDRGDRAIWLTESALSAFISPPKAPAPEAAPAVPAAATPEVPSVGSGG